MRAANFGPLVVNTDVDAAILQKLELWVPLYLSQLERERNLADPLVEKRLDRPPEVSYANTLDDDEFPDHILPAVIVTTANTEGEPTKDGNGMYSCAWNVVVSCIVKARTPSETRQLAAWFEGCIRRIMLDDDPPFDGEVRWTGTNTAAVADPTGAGRYLAAGISTYVVYVDQVVLAGGGPEGPPVYEDPDPANRPDDPFVDRVTVGSVTTDVIGKSPESDLGS